MDTDTIDAMMGDRFRIVQSGTGHRAGLDAMLLAATVPADASGRLIDLGAGCGTVAFAALTRAPNLEATAVEIDELECERMTVALRLDQNAHLKERIEIVQGNVETFKEREYDFALTNPPYNDSSQRPSPNADRRRARSVTDPRPCFAGRLQRVARFDPMVWRRSYCGKAHGPMPRSLDAWAISGS